MGSKISIFSKLYSVSNEDSTRLTSAGLCHHPFTFSEDKPNHCFEEAMSTIFATVLRDRRAVIDAKDKYRDMNLNLIRDKYPHWSYDQIMDLKAQFQSFDINQDGLIDFQELCNVLDELGDTSDEETRQQYFEELDEDGSGAVDFDEYLMLVDSVLSGDMALNTIGELCKNGTENAQRLRKLSIVEQIEHGLF